MLSFFCAQMPIVMFIPGVPFAFLSIFLGMGAPALMPACKPKRSVWAWALLAIRQRTMMNSLGYCMLGVCGVCLFFCDGLLVDGLVGFVVDN